MAELGFVGLGTMGSAMARRLLERGHTVRVWNRSPEAIDRLVAVGARAADSPADALRTGVAISMLSDDAAADAVWDEATLAAAPSALHINMASVSPELSRRLGERHAAAGVSYLAAPVLGRSNLAAEGKLNILAAGASTDVERAAEFFDALGARTWRFGEEPDQANLVKIAVNFNIIHAMEAIGESIAIVENHGIAATQFTELLSSTLFGGVSYTVYGDIIANRRYLPAGLTLPLGLKDLGLAETAAAQVGVVLPTAPALRAVFEQALAAPDAEKLDWSAIAEISRTVHR
jgi:3-hydroxyisobutyrate dehydrogenase-like beta-hydroxyacid dehydrogenase